MVIALWVITGAYGNIISDDSPTNAIYKIISHRNWRLSRSRNTDYTIWGNETVFFLVEITEDTPRKGYIFSLKNH